MRPVQQTVVGVAIGAWLPVERFPSGAGSLGYGVRISATATYNVEYTYENVLAGAVPTTFFAAQSAQTTNKDGAIGQPISAIRLNVTASTGSVTMDVLQGVKG